MKESLPLVSEAIGFKLKKLGFNWFVNTKYTEGEGFSNSITLSGCNWNSDVWDDTSLGQMCSIPSVGLAIRWLELQHGLYIGKDWFEREFKLIDFKTSEPDEPIITLDIGDFESIDELTHFIVDRALDYLVMVYFPVFGDVVRLTNKCYGRCIGNNKAVYFPDAPVIERAEIGDVDIQYLLNNGKNQFEDKSVPTLEDIQKFKTPEPTN